MNDEAARYRWLVGLEEIGLFLITGAPNVQALQQIASRVAFLRSTNYGYSLKRVQKYFLTFYFSSSVIFMAGCTLTNYILLLSLLLLLLSLLLYGCFQFTKAVISLSLIIRSFNSLPAYPVIRNNF